MELPLTPLEFARRTWGGTENTCLDNSWGLVSRL